VKDRLLILTAGFGEGHNAAARAMASAWNALHGPDTAPVADIYALASPRMAALARRGYLGLINRAPRLWSRAYRWLDQSRMSPVLLRGTPTERRVLAELIAREQPAAIACTYPAYAFMLARLRQAGLVEMPIFNIVTDSISINSLWWRSGAAGWFLPNEDSAEVLLRAGADPSRLHVLGFPVASFFAENENRFAPPSLTAGAAPRVLYIINSGTRGAAETARRLLLQPNWEVTCTVGRDEKLRAALSRLASGRPVAANILGWTNEIPRLLMSHHVVVSKAGGATTQEALAARCPMIVNLVVPGQEEGNSELLRRHGIGAFAEDPDAVVRELQRAFRDGGAVWKKWRSASEPLYRPRAALEIAAEVYRRVRAKRDSDAISSSPSTKVPRRSRADSLHPTDTTSHRAPGSASASV